MTASTTKSSKVSNDFDALPRTIEPAGKNGGLIKVSVDSTTLATTQLDDIGDITLMLPLDSNTRLHSLKIYNDDLDSGGTSGAIKVGLFNGPDAFTSAAGTRYAAYAAISDSLFQNASTELTAANTTGTDLRFTKLGIANAGSRLFELAGLTVDPVKKFLVGLTITTAMTTPVAGTVTLTATHGD